MSYSSVDQNTVFIYCFFFQFLTKGGLYSGGYHPSSILFTGRGTYNLVGLISGSLISGSLPYILKWSIPPLMNMLLYFQTIWIGEKQKVTLDAFGSCKTFYKKERSRIIRNSLWTGTLIVLIVELVDWLRILVVLNILHAQQDTLRHKKEVVLLCLQCE